MQVRRDKRHSALLTVIVPMLIAEIARAGGMGEKTAMEKFYALHVSACFARYGLFDYFMRYFGSLHTTGVNYIVADLDSYVGAHPSLAHQPI